MPRAKKKAEEEGAQTVYLAGELERVEEDESDESIDENYQKTDEFINGFMGVENEGLGEISVKRPIKGTSDHSPVEIVPVDKFPTVDHLHDYIRDTYGAGDYRYWLMTYNDRGVLKQKTNKFFTLAPKINKESDTKKANDLSNETSDLLKELLSQTSQKKQGVDWSDFLLKAAAVTTAVTPVVTMIIKALPEKRDPYKEAMGKLKIAEKVQELNSDVGDEPEKNLMDYVEDFLQVARDLSKNAPAQAGNVLQNNSENISESAPVNHSNMSEVYVDYRPFFEVLLQIDKSEHDVKTLARDLVPKFTPEQIELFLTLINMDDPLAFILAYNADFIPHCNWIIDFLNELEAALPVELGGDGDGHLQEEFDISDNGSDNKKKGSASDDGRPASNSTPSKGGHVIEAE